MFLTYSSLQIDFREIDERVLDDDLFVHPLVRTTMTERVTKAFKLTIPDIM